MDAPEDMKGAEAQGWRGFHSGIGLNHNGAAPRAWRGNEAALFLRGWWLAYAKHYGDGAAAFAAMNADPHPDGEPINPHPQFSAPWEAWAAGFEAQAQQEG